MGSARRIEAFLQTIREVQTAPDTKALFSRFDRLAYDYGVTGYVVNAFRSDDHDLLHIHDSLNAWIAVYEGDQLFKDCPMTAYVQEATVPAALESFSDAVRPRAKRVMDIAAEMGVAHGLAVPVVRQNGERAAVGLVACEPISNSADFLELHMLANALAVQLTELRRQEGCPPLKLSPRETEVLRWFAEGKSAEDVGTILDISAGTVMFHYNNAALRLGTLNRTHTVVEAMRRGLLS